MIIAKEGNNLVITINTDTTAKTFSSGKEGWYERADLKIGNKVYTAQVQIYEKTSKSKSITE